MLTADHAGLYCAPKLRAPVAEGLGGKRASKSLSFWPSPPLGHNFGLNHDRYVAGDVPATDYNFGYVDKDKRVRTVMAYNDECVANHIDCQRYPLFSSLRSRASPSASLMARRKAPITSRSSAAPRRSSPTTDSQAP